MICQFCASEDIFKISMEYYFWWDKGYDEYKVIQPTLEKDISCKFLVVGGGISGLHAALELTNQGVKNIVLIEKWECGRGTTGASTGFLMPGEEAMLTDLLEHYGKVDGQYLWNFVQRGVDLMASTAKENQLDVDLREQPNVSIATSQTQSKTIQEEHKALTEAGFQPEKWDQTQIASHLGTTLVQSATMYGNTYGINPLKYAHALKLLLIQKGVKIFENTVLESISQTEAIANTKKITFEHAIVAINKPSPTLSSVGDKVAGAQSSAVVSEVLNQEQITSLFPDGQSYMVWDTAEFYLYFRLTADNRIIMGKDNILTLLSPTASQNTIPANAAINNFKKLFPQLLSLEFPYYWSEIIDGTYDLIPLIKTEGNIVSSGGNVGLPWASNIGALSALVCLGKTEIPAIFSVSRVPSTLHFQNKYLRMAEYSLYFGLAELKRKS